MPRDHLRKAARLLYELHRAGFPSVGIGETDARPIRDPSLSDGTPHPQTLSATGYETADAHGVPGKQATWALAMAMKANPRLRRQLAKVANIDPSSL